MSPETFEAIRLLVNIQMTENRGKKSVNIGYGAALSVPEPDEKLASTIDMLAAACNSQIEPHLAEVATVSCHISQMLPGQEIVLFGLKFLVTQEKTGPCMFSAEIVIDETVSKLKEGLIADIANACYRECVPMLAGRFEHWDYGEVKQEQI